MMTAVRQRHIPSRWGDQCVVETSSQTHQILCAAEFVPRLSHRTNPTASTLDTVSHARHLSARLHAHETPADKPRNSNMITTRFAPSPTGRLHLGTAFAALVAWRTARDAGGRFLLRIEDIDHARCRPEYTDGIIEDLAWLGLDWDETPRRQSEHMADYQTALDRLRPLLYPCFCSRADIAAAGNAPHGPDGPIYPGTCKRLSEDERQSRLAAGEPRAWRLDMDRAATQGLTFEEQGEPPVHCHPERFGDMVLARKDTPSSYHLCATHDDALQGVTLVTRGADLKPATELHRLLQHLMGWPTPRYAHHRVLTDAAGKRLAKRDDSTTLRTLRAAGHTPAEVRAMAGFPT